MSWSLSLNQAANRDLDEVLIYTQQRFGESKALDILNLFDAATDAIERNPFDIKSKPLSENEPDLRRYDIRQPGHNARHLLIYRVNHNSHTVEVLRLLHDAMDLPRQLLQDD